MPTDDGTPGAQAPAEQPGMQTQAPAAAASEPPDTDALDKNLLRQAVIIGAIVLVVLIAAFFGAF
ncbi:MAG: hypothetical protein QF654_02880 [Alphaproteobacteria bacterium]|jgi:hypothetical protein|nr:hypothetical protein [Alphaproteobacteria bacterium]|tara:strand:+ start:310 stop:504 length:195 start_codon:yes stop_codon:yes gene_type:complete